MKNFPQEVIRIIHIGNPALPEYTGWIGVNACRVILESRDDFNLHGDTQVGLPHFRHCIGHIEACPGSHITVSVDQHGDFWEKPNCLNSPPRFR